MTERTTNNGQRGTRRAPETPCIVPGCATPRVGPTEGRPFCRSHEECVSASTKGRIRWLADGQKSGLTPAEKYQERWEAEVEAAIEEIGPPRRVQQKREKGWRMPPNTRGVARPGPFGNPFKVGDKWDQAWVWNLPAWREEDTLYGETTVSQALAVEMFEDWLNGGEKSGIDDYEVQRAEILRRLPELRGRNLACFCPLELPCHADVLLRLANEGAR